MKCPFCYIDQNQKIADSKFSYAKFDVFPITEGHALVISKKHVSNYFDLSQDEQMDMMNLVAQVKNDFDKKYGLSDYNIGINCGALAGQTIDHVHIHLIPRRKGDVGDPRGGVRWVIPNKAKYWDE